MSLAQPQVSVEPSGDLTFHLNLIMVLRACEFLKLIMSWYLL